MSLLLSFTTINCTNLNIRRTRSAPAILHRKEVIKKLSDMLKNTLIKEFRPQKQQYEPQDEQQYEPQNIFISKEPPKDFVTPSFFKLPHRSVKMRERYKNPGSNQPNLRPSPLPF